MKDVCPMRNILNLSLFFWASFACLPAAEEPEEENHFQRIEHLYILSFDQWGVLINPAELEFAIKELGEDPSVEQLFFLLLLFAGIIPLTIISLLLISQNREILETQEKTNLTRSAMSLSVQLSDYLQWESADYMGEYLLGV